MINFVLTRFLVPLLILLAKSYSPYFSLNSPCQNKAFRDLKLLRQQYPMLLDPLFLQITLGKGLIDSFFQYTNLDRLKSPNKFRLDRAWCCDRIRSSGCCKIPPQPPLLLLPIVSMKGETQNCQTCIHKSYRSVKVCCVYESIANYIISYCLICESSG